MPEIVTKHVPEVTHVGFLEAPLTDPVPTRDGPGLAVSTDPASWRTMKGLNAPDVSLKCPSAEWMDPLAMTGEDTREIAAWMVNRGYMDEVSAWQVAWFDEESGDFHEETRESRQDAARLAGRTLDQELEAEAVGEAATMETTTFRLSRKAMKRLGRWPDAGTWYDAAILLYAREVVLPKRPMVVGIWWSEADDSSMNTAPYGVVFPERLPRFEVETEDGDEVTFAEAFPEFDTAPKFAARELTVD